MKRSVFTMLAVMLLTLTAMNACAQKSNEIVEQKIKVFFHCPNGKALIEKELVKEKGVKEVSADLETKIVTVKYESSKNDKDGLVAAIEKIGYLTEFSKEGAKINKACSHEGEHKD